MFFTIKPIILYFTLYFKLKNVCLDTLDPIVPITVFSRSTERIARNGVIAAMIDVMCLQVVGISQHSQLLQRVRDFEKSNWFTVNRSIYK